MKQVNNGYAAYYYMTEDGNVYNAATKKTMLPDKRHKFRLKKEDGKTQQIAQRVLYRKVYNMSLCRDRIKSLEGEQWKEVQQSEGLYYVSSKGRIKSMQGYEAIIMKPYKNVAGYERVDITQYGIRRSALVHRLVAAAFLPLPKDIEMQLHHKDFNNRNNAVDNLEWLTPEEHKAKHERRYKEDGSTKPEKNTDRKKQ